MEHDEEDEDLADLRNEVSEVLTPVEVMGVDLFLVLSTLWFSCCLLLRHLLLLNFYRIFSRQLR